MIGGGTSMGGGRSEGGRQDTQGGRSREKEEINFATLHNVLPQKKHTEAGTNKGGGGRGGQEPGVEGTGSGKFRTP